MVVGSLPSIPARLHRIVSKHVRTINTSTRPACAIVHVSVVIATYAPELYEHCCEAIESVLQQKYDDVDVIVVVDGDESLCARARNDLDAVDRITVLCNDENLGLSASRNRAIEVAIGDVVAFMDDDAVAEPTWIEELVRAYTERDAIAAGGPMTPIWVAERPRFFPEEFYWLVGVTHPGFAEPWEEVRNTFGSNISVKRDVLCELGGFESRVGRRGEMNLQAEEPELGLRMQREFGRGVVYNPDAKVGHKVFAYRTDLWWLVNRCFWQGYSKRVMERLASDVSTEESQYLRALLTRFVPRRVKSLLVRPRLEKLLQLVTLLLFTGVVGVGYLYAVLRER